MARRVNPVPNELTLLSGAFALLLGSSVAAATGSRTADTAGQSANECCAVVELRQYTLYPGKRDTLIALFEDKFIESQEGVGITVAGQFRDVNDPNRFVWIRGFDSMPARLKALTDFYYGPIWQAHRNQANQTLYDSDNVLLLRPASAGSGLVVDRGKRLAVDDRPARSEFIVATIYYFEASVPAEFIARFDRDLMPQFEKAGARVLARYVSEPSENTFKALPVRAKDHVFVWFASFTDRWAYDKYNVALAKNERWSNEWFASLNKALQKPPETLMLRPTGRSLVGH